MDMAEKTDTGLSESQTPETVRQTVGGSGMFSIESILRSGGLRYGGVQPGPGFPGLGGHLDGVKKEEMEEDDLQERRPGPLGHPGVPGSSLHHQDTAACHDDSGERWRHHDHGALVCVSHGLFVYPILG